ncbi:CU044_2847 family protein [Streptomyces sp. NPDC127091]|uniref:CU044_2847 family protein n=1 Tax=unclassified Streptomyces TaxID=2593676 RepID=UPI00365DEE6B
MLVQFDLGDGDFVVADIERVGGGVVDAATPSDLVARATGSFTTALEQVRSAAALTVRRMRDLPQRPDEVTVEFGIRLEAEVGAVLARTGAQGHLQVQLTWRNENRADAEQAGGEGGEETSRAGRAPASPEPLLP